MTSSPGIQSYGRYEKDNQGVETFIKLELHILENSKDVFYDTICSNSASNLLGIPLTESGMYKVNFSNHNGCDSVVELYIHKIESYYSESSVGMCAGELPYVLQGKEYWQSEIIGDTLVSSTQCDSIIAINFTVWPAYDIDEVHAIYLSELPYSYLDTTLMEDTPLGTII